MFLLLTIWYRNRFVFNWSKSGILRCESIYKAELSDTFHVTFQAPKDPHPWTALVMSIALGKYDDMVNLSVTYLLRTNTVYNYRRKDKSRLYQAIR